MVDNQFCLILRLALLIFGTLFLYTSSSPQKKVAGRKNKHLKGTSPDGEGYQGDGR